MHPTKTFFVKQKKKNNENIMKTVIENKTSLHIV